MSRCWSCCQENCGYTNCSCSCHGKEKRELEAVPKEKPKLENHPHAGNKQPCPECRHEMWEHYVEGGRYRCYERLSYDNNDFCGCTHCMPEHLKPQTYTFYAVADRDDLAEARWYRTYSSQRSSGWQDDLEDAKIWTKRSAAKSKCTSLGTSARIVEFVVTKVNVIDNSEHVKKAAEKRKQEEARRAAAVKQHMLDLAKLELERAQEKLRKLQENR